MSRWWLALVTLVGAALLVGCDGDAEGDEDADLEAAIAFLDAAIRVDIRPSEGDILYWRLEDEGLTAQSPPLRESWYRIGPNLLAAESLHRELGADGSLRSELHSTDGSQLVWRKDSAYGARTGLVDGSWRLLELTDETVTVEFSFAVGDDSGISSQAERLGIEDAVEEVARITVDGHGIEVERHMFVLTERGEEITLYRSHASREIVDDMPTPTPR
jgi:hypothetical protein